jgi:16S rRNA processing protein RimM
MQGETGRTVNSDITHLVIGRIAGPRGVRGELKVSIETEDPARFLDLQSVYLGESRERFVVARARLFKDHALLTLVGLNTREAAERWRGAYVYVPLKDALPLEDGSYYYYQIRGLSVVTDEDEDLGRVIEILATGANDVYVVRGQTGELLIPALKQVILQIDLEAGRMVVHLPEGLR